MPLGMPALGAPTGDLDMLCKQDPHFYRFAKLMERLAAGIGAGNFDDILGKRQ
jgi:hypothetical protein